MLLAFKKLRNFRFGTLKSIDRTILSKNEAYVYFSSFFDLTELNCYLSLALFRGMRAAAHGKVSGGFCERKTANLIDS